LSRVRFEQAKVVAGKEVALQDERVVDRGVQAQKTLGRSGRLEVRHLALSSSDRLMRILSPIVRAQVPLMPGRKTQVSPRGTIGPQFVGHPHFWSKTLRSEQFSHQSHRDLLVSSRLHKQIEDFASLSTARRSHW
jgi:hypothetical protein